MKSPMKRFLLVPLLALLALSAVGSVGAQGEPPLALVMTADGAITPAMAQYVTRGIQTAEHRQAEVLILQLNTPGGDIESMLRMVETIRGSRVPVIVYITPRGGMAASAGTIVTLAGHVAAMAPETAIGAASPVGTQGEDLAETLKAKVSESLKAQARALSERRGPRAISLAEEMIDSARAVSSREALEAGLVDFLADDLDDLLAQLDGFQVETIEGPRTLHTANARTEDLPMRFIEELLQVLVNPNIVFLLLTIGVQALLIELSSPGGWVAGFIGVTCLTLAAYGLGILPVNWFGIVFLVIAFVLFVLDIKAPTHGALTAAGVASFIVGALVLFNSPRTPQFQRVSLPLVILTGILTGAGFAVILGFALRAQRAPVRIGRETLIGQKGRARTRLDPEGQVQVGSELWTAELVEGSEAARKGDRAEVVSVDGVRLKVRKVHEKDA